MTPRDSASVRRRRVFSVAGVDCFLTLYAWLSVPFFIAIGLFVALVQRADDRPAAVFPAGLAYGLLLFLSHVFHTVGHVLAGRIVGAPNGSVVITSTFHINRHRCDPAYCSRWTHIGRAAGGPVATLALAGIALALHAAAGGEWFEFLTKANWIVGICLLFPMPGIDGWVIWGELLGFRRRS